MMKEEIRYSTQSHKDDINIARELLYPRSVIRKLEDEKNPWARQRILKDARNGIYD